MCGYAIGSTNTEETVLKQTVLLALFLVSLCGVSAAFEGPHSSPRARSTKSGPMRYAAEVDISQPMRACRACHGTNLHGKRAAPNIAGWSAAKVKRSLTTNVPRSMVAISKRLTPKQIDAISKAISKMAKSSKKT